MSIRTEEEVGQPGGVLAGYVDNGEVKHVDHTTMQPARITTAVREEGGDLGIGALTEDAPIKHTVDDVAHGPRGNEGDAKQHTELGVFLR